VAIKDIGSSWKSDLKTLTNEERYYIDFRQHLYPPYDSDLAYTAITAANEAGSHNLTSGHCDYLLPLTSTLTIYAKIKPTFDYDTADDQPLWAWYVDSDNYLKLEYDAGDDQFQVKWKDGGTERILQSSAYTDNPSLQTWIELACSIDLTTGDTSGGALYVDGSAADTTWSGNIDAKGMEYPLFSVRHEDGTEGAYTINQIRVFLSKTTTAAQVANNFKALKDEEIVWHFNGEGCGRTRCNVTSFVTSMTNSKSIEEPTNGSQVANSLSLTLNSINGEFADDQYAAFDPANSVYNGTSAQAYMKHRCRVEAETWYSGNWEPFFIGRLDSGLFARTSVFDGLSYVQIVAEDGVSDIGRTITIAGKSWEDKKLSDSTEADSLFHLIARLATKKDIYNYVANSSFENATIANSWAVAGTGATFSRVAGGLFGSYQGDLVYGSAACTVQQTVTFLGTKKLNVGETYNFSIYLKSSAACGDSIVLAEHDSGGSNDSSAGAYSISGGEGWGKYEVSHTITDGDSDRLVVTVELDDNVTLSMDGAMLVQNDAALNWFILNNNDGSSGTESADDADSDSYDTIGIIADAVDITHPWAIVPRGDTPWDHLKELADASGSMYLGMDASNTLRLISKLATGYSDPSSIETIGDSDIQDVNSILDVAQANKILVRGVKIKKNENMQNVWDARSVKDFTSLGDRLAESVADGDDWPDPDTYGEFVAEFDTKFLWDV